MEPEGRIPCLRKGTTCFSFQNQINQVHTLLLAPSLFKSGVSYSEFLTKTFYSSLFSPCMLYTPPISYSSYYKNNLIWSRSYEAYHYVNIISLLLLHPCYVYLFPGSNNRLGCSLKVRAKSHIY
jgi:hypothetical protein